MSVDTGSNINPTQASTPGWTPPKTNGNPFMAFPLIILEYMIYVGMAGCQDQLTNNLNYDNDMQPAQADIIQFYAYLNQIEAEAGQKGIDPKEAAKLAKEMAALMKKFFGNSVLPSSASGWSTNAQPGQPGYIDPNSDFGKWMIALQKANTNANGQPINNWPGFGGDTSVATVTNMMNDLNGLEGENGDTFLQNLLNGDTDPGTLEADIQQLAIDYWQNKQPNQTSAPTDSLSLFATDANSVNAIYRGIGTAQTTLIQQLSATLNGFNDNGNNVIKSADSLTGAINSNISKAG